MAEEAIKIAVLEQRVSDFNNMFSKIDDAISKLSDVNANITKMLAVHEERIEQGNKSDDSIIKMIENFKYENSREHQEAIARINIFEKKVEDISRFKWMASGILAVIIFIAPIATNYVTNLTNNSQIYKIK